MPEIKDSLAKGIEVLIAEQQKKAQSLAYQKTGSEDKASEQEFDAEILIIGSGYGGAIAASRLARMQSDGKAAPRIMLLERGREFMSGDFPGSFAMLPSEVRIQSSKSDSLLGNTQGLYDFHFNPDVSVLCGNGLGGGSLINASVAERMHAARWQEAAWPSELREQANDFGKYYEYVEDMLQVRPLPPAQWPEKTRQLQALADTQPSHRFRAVNLAVSQENGDNRHGIQQQACNGCGDCFTGCNFNAKNSLNLNYLPDAWHSGVEMYTGVTVQYISPYTSAQGDAGWQVHACATAQTHDGAQRDVLILHAKRVILAAGSLGSTEILLRSRAHGLTVSNTLGQKFSGNGDMIWAGYAQKNPVHITASESTPHVQRKVGPTITAMWDMRENAEYPHVIQDAAVPASMSRIFGEIIANTALLYRMADTCPDDTEMLRTGSDPDAVNSDMLQHTALYLSMGCDEAAGKIEFIAPSTNTQQAGRIQIVWKQAGKQSLYKLKEQGLQQAVSGLGGKLLSNPAWRAFPQRLANVLGGKQPDGNIITVHPLGGCAMADDASQGVVNHAGAVFSGTQGKAVHAGLYVWDGATLPLAIGINPLLTIAALAERAADLLAAELGRCIVRTPLPGKLRKPLHYQAIVPALPPIAKGTELAFSEVMRGDLMPTAKLAGQPPTHASLRVNFLFNMPLEAFLNDPKRSLNITDACLTLKDGTQIRVQGKVEWLHLVPRHKLRKMALASCTYYRLRAKADLYRHVKEHLEDRDGNGPPPNWRAALAVAMMPSDTSLLGELLNLASHIGSLRELRYELQALPGQTGRLFGKQDWQLRGVKRVEYQPGKNLWQQLSDLQVKLRDHKGQELANGVLKLDWNLLLKEEKTRIAACEHNPQAWLDLMSMSGFFLRAVLRIHFWSFRKPDYPTAKRRFPRPGNLPGLPAPAWHVVRVPQTDGVCIELHHYAQTESNNSTLPPVLLIHGFGASSLQFASPAMPENLTQYLHRQGHEVWLLDLRTSVSLATSAQQWKLDEIAQQDIPTAVRFILAAYGQRFAGLDVIAHCIGSAMFNIAALAGRLQHPHGESMVRSAVLLQVGPMFQVSKSNQVRGLGAKQGRDWMNFDSIDSSMDESTAVWADILLDRVLATHPLPPDEAAKLRQRGWWQAPRTDLANYFRSTGVFGRLFEIDNLSQEVRDGLGDLLGQTNLTTYRQILHSLLAERLVDQYGRNIYVRDSNFAHYYRFPILFLHGKKNDVFDAACTKDSAAHLNSIFGGQSFIWHELADYGHLDPLVGKNAVEDVFQKIGHFLQNLPARPAQVQLASSAEYFRLPPQLGPILGWSRRAADGSLLQRLWFKVQEVVQDADLAESFLLDHDEQIIPASYQQHALLPFPRFAIAVCDIRLPAGKEQARIVVCSRHLRRLHQLPEAQNHPHVVPPLPEPEQVLQALRDLPQLGAQADAAQQAMQAWQAWRAGQPQRDPQQRYAAGYGVAQVHPAASDAPAANDLCFALGSCRYSGTNLEATLGEAAFVSLHQHLHDPHTPAEWRPAFNLQMGDQIYVDATAGVMERQKRLEVFLERYEDAYSGDGVRQLFATLPSYMMLDDHEIQNDWEPGDARDHEQLAWQSMAMSSFIAYQWASGPHNPDACSAHGQHASHARHLWYSFEQRGMAFFVLDTRTERRAQDQNGAAQLLSQEQLSALSNWLAVWSTRDCPKFIVSPCALAPVGRDHTQHYRSRSDGWQAYPATLRALTDILLQHRSSKVVMLCGDLHANFACQVKLQRHDQQVRLHTIVISGLYAPYPFANTDPASTLDQLDEDLGQGYRFSYEKKWSPPPTQSFGLLRVWQGAQGWQLQLFSLTDKNNQHLIFL